MNTNNRRADSMISDWQKRFARQLKDKQLALEFETNSTRDQLPRPVDQALSILIQNAIEQSMDNGELSITILESPEQWEIEVADYRVWEAKYESEPVSEVIFEKSAVNSNPDRLARTQFFLQSIGGHLKSYRCPQGGIANLLTVPQTREHDH